MKNKNLGISTVFLAINFILFLILSFYHLFNFILSSAVIVFNYYIIHLLFKSNTTSGMKVSLPYIFTALNLLSFILSLFSIDNIQDNYIITSIIIITGIQFIFMVFQKKH